MQLSLRITRSEGLFFVVGLVLLCVLIILPPLEVAGLPMLFYMIPALLMGYCLPFWFYSVSVILGFGFAFLTVSDLSDSSMPEAVVTSILLLCLMGWRQVKVRADTLLIATTLLFLLAFPLLSLLNYYWAGLNPYHSVLLASRFVINSLFSVLCAEALVMLVTLSQWPALQVIRAALGFRPSLVQIIELLVTVSVAVSLMSTLMLFWRDWDSSLKTQVRVAADTRLNTLYGTAKATMTERMAQASISAANLREIGLEDKALDEIGRLLTHDLATYQDKFVGPLDYAVVFPDGPIVSTTGFSAKAVERALALARAQSSNANELLAINIRLADGEKHDVSVFLGDATRPSILTLYHSPDDALLFQFRLAMNGYQEIYGDSLLQANADAAGAIGQFGLPLGAEVLAEPDNDRVGWVLTGVDTRRPKGRVFISRITEGTNLTLMPSLQASERFSRALHSTDRFRVTLSYWPYFLSYAESVILSAIVTFTILLVLLWGSRTIVGRLVAPLGELTQIFDSWRQFRGGELGSGAALQAMDVRGFSALSDIHSLQVGFRSLAQDVMYGERRLSTIAANYDELLRSLPLGVLAIDGNSRVQFLNDALGEITEQRQDAIGRLKSHAAQMLATNTTVEEWQLTLEDRPPKSLLLVVNPRLDDRGQESGLWVIATDLTEQKQTSAQLIQAAKLATLGEMSTGMAHELNQPLNVISLATSNLRFTIKKGKATPENTLTKLDRVDAAVHRAASIIDHMRAYGRLAGEGLSEINVGEICKGACNLLSEQLKLANIALINEVPTEGLLVKGNAIQLEQVLINLINNAKDAIKEQAQEGSVTLDAEINGSKMLLRVTDTGGGIPNHVLPHIFEPFFTTKPVGKGTGLGGSISYGIVREMQGDIWVQNVPGGAQITISLPLMSRV